MQKCISVFTVLQKLALMYFRKNANTGLHYFVLMY